jgi:hypothetical protein
MELANKQNYYHKHTKGPANHGVGYPFGGQVVKPLDLRRYVSGLDMRTLAALPPILNGRLGLVNLPQYSSFGRARCRPSRYFISLLRSPDVAFVLFLVARLHI